MIALGAVHFSPAEVALILAVLVFGSIALALPATLTLAWVGYRRGGRRKAANALGYWLGGTALSIVTMAIARGHVGMWSVLIGWIPTLLLAVALKPRPTPNPS